MKLLKLDICNIASIERATIDWREGAFQNESIFLIYGETGSGKSTILDAICLALYKKTPRLETASGNVYVDEAFSKRGGGEVLSGTSDVEQYIRRGIRPGEECFVELLFEGNDNAEYTARLEFLLTNTGNLKDTVWTLTQPDGTVLRGKGAGNLKDGISDKVVSPVINRLVGLDYRQFCRTTMLAQGEFTKFLKASDKERCEILEKITDTGRFKLIGEALSNRLTAEQKRLEDLRTERRGLPILDKNEVAALRAELTMLRIRGYHHRLRSEYLAQRIEWIDTARLLWQKREEANRVLKSVRDTMPPESSEQLKAVMEQAQKAASAVDLSELTRQRNEQQTRLRWVEDLQKAIATYAEKEKAVQSAECRVQSAKCKVESAEGEVKHAETEREQAKENYRIADKLYNETADRLGHVAAIVTHLSDGETCPVCGNVYHALETEDVLQPLREAREKADAHYRQCDKNYTDATKMERDSKAAYSRESATLENVYRAELKRVEQEAQSLKFKVQGEEIGDRTEELKQSTQSKIQALDAEIAKVKPLQDAYQKAAAAYQHRLAEENRLTAAQTTATNCEREYAHHLLDNRSWGCHDRNTMALQKQTVDEAQAEINQRMGAIREQISTNEKYEKRAHELDIQAEAQQQTVNGWEAVCRDFSGKSKDRFSRIAQGYILRELLEYANEYLARFTTRYLLSMQTDSTAILVKDLYCGGIARPVDMLSGGESFMISLSLALGLIRLGSSSFRVDTLFIDEGFGTLDANSLETIIATLEKLQQLSGRRVGIISHVKELRQRIGLRISVRRKAGASAVSEVEIEQ